MRWKVERTTVSTIRPDGYPRWFGDEDREGQPTSRMNGPDVARTAPRPTEWRAASAQQSEPLAVDPYRLTRSNVERYSTRLDYRLDAGSFGVSVGRSVLRTTSTGTDGRTVGVVIAVDERAQLSFDD
jgi:hypothetical protein